MPLLGAGFETYIREEHSRSTSALFVKAKKGLGKKPSLGVDDDLAH